MRSLLASKLPPSFTPAFATKAGSTSFPPILRPIALVAGVGALATGAVCAHETLAGATVRLRSLDAAPTALAGAALLLALASSAFAWRCALRSAGGEIRLGTACGCYGLGSLTDAVLPARLGDASVAFGTGGWLALRSARPRPRQPVPEFSSGGQDS